MERIEVTAIFDIGKTNKKFFLFDKNLHPLFQANETLATIPDDDGEACESLDALTQWMKTTLDEALAMSQFRITQLNFTSYGASFVHIDKAGRPVAPLYNYLKKYPEDILQQFYAQCGPAEKFSRETSSPTLGMLNSGLQLYWLKYAKPAIFQKIHQSLHLPQYLSFLFTGKAVSEYTSIGCHTGLWDFGTGDYHAWVYQEEIDRILPPIVPTQTSFEGKIGDQSLQIGVGIHDSSAALLPYLESSKEPFALLSTGTWSISINPSNAQPLTTEELRQDCLHFLSRDGRPIKISRLFVGEEHRVQAELLQTHFSVSQDAYRELAFDAALYEKVKANPEKRFRFQLLNPAVLGSKTALETDLNSFENFSEAYHCLIHELTELQILSLNLVLNGTQVRKLFIDGGFSTNPIFVDMLRRKLPSFQIETADFALGTAMGAAMVMETGKFTRQSM
jgi:sugar (pentulose or hexulose) kinase